MVACGKETGSTTSAVWDLPSVCSYTSSTDTTSMGIKVTYDATGVTTCLFAAS